LFSCGLQGERAQTTIPPAVIDGDWNLIQTIFNPLTKIVPAFMEGEQVMINVKYWCPSLDI